MISSASCDIVTPNFHFTTNKFFHAMLCSALVNQMLCMSLFFTSIALLN